MTLFPYQTQHHMIRTVYHLAALYEVFYNLLRAIPGISGTDMWKATLNKIPLGGV